MKIENLLVVISLFFILFSIFSLFGTMTGYATLGIVNITVNRFVAINFTTDYVSFGVGTVTLGEDNAIIDTRGEVVGGNWTPLTEGFVLENIGNEAASIYIRSSKDAREFLGGTNPQYEFSIENLEANSCKNESVVFGDWYSVSSVSNGILVCEEFSPLSNSNSINLDVRLTIPSDATVGTLQDVFTALAVAI